MFPQRTVGSKLRWFTDKIKRMSHIKKMTSAYSAVLGPHLDLVLLGADKMIFLQLFQKSAGQQTMLFVNASQVFSLGSILEAHSMLQRHTDEGWECSSLDRVLAGYILSPRFHLQCHTKPGVVVHAYNLSTLDGGRRSKIQGHLWLHGEVETSLVLCEALISRKTKYIDKPVYLLSKLRPNKGIQRVN